MNAIPFTVGKKNHEILKNKINNKIIVNTCTLKILGEVKDL